MQQAASPPVGYLIAHTMPAARVLIDGKDTGKETPVSPKARIELPPGRHVVTFLVAGQRFSYPIAITAGQTTRLVRQLAVPPKLPWSKDRVCKRDSDCVLLKTPRNRTCACGSVWKTAVNRTTTKKWPIHRPCRCYTRWLGNKAVCVKGQCAVRQAAKAAPTSLRCNIKSKVCHRPSCKHYHCKNCTVTFGSEAAAKKAGYQVHRGNNQ